MSATHPNPVPKEMQAAAIDRFGGPEVLHLETLPVPQPKDSEVLIKLRTAGIGVWDPYLREGELSSGTSTFPKVIGNDGAGEVVAVGAKVQRFRVGDPVYAFAMEGGFYAQYVAVKEAQVAPLPSGLKLDQAGALGADGITALRGLDDQLRLRPDESLLIFGASGGIGHLAVQLAKRMRARVFAVASGSDGVALAKRLGADAAVDGKKGDVAKAARGTFPEGFDAALVLASSPSLESALSLLKEGGRLAYPHGVEPPPQAPTGVTAHAYDGTPDPDAFKRLNALISRGPFHVELSRTYRLDEAARAHRELGEHHLGKRAIEVRA
jgi:NADPH:quinone reductase-like Zn-dependent oxidoreductase